MKGITIEGVPIEVFIKEKREENPEIYKIIKTAQRAISNIKTKVKFESRAERHGKVKIYSKKEIKILMSHTLARQVIIKALKENDSITSMEIIRNNPTLKPAEVYQTLARIEKRFSCVSKEKIEGKLEYFLDATYKNKEVDEWPTGKEEKKKKDIDRDQEDCAQILQTFVNNVLNKRLEVTNLETHYDQVADTKELIIVFKNRR